MTARSGPGGTATGEVGASEVATAVRDLLGPLEVYDPDGRSLRDRVRQRP